MKTFLGFGANEAIARYHRNSILSQNQNEIQGLTDDNSLPDPCFPKGLDKNLTVHLDLNHVKDYVAKKNLSNEQVLFLSGTGNFF